MYKLPLFFFVFFISIVSCQKKQDSDLTLPSKADTVITIIFKERSFKSDTLRLKTGPYSFREDNMLYSFEGDFVPHIIQKKNYKKNDTLKIKTSSDIILSHGYNVNQYSLYQFKPGDVVVFDYPQDNPRCEVLNRKILKNDLNFITELNVKTSKNIKSDFQFFIENKRFRTKEEKDKISKEYFESRRIKFDSIYKTSAISEQLYTLIKTDLDYLQKDASNRNILKNPVKLSLPSGRNLIIKSFESIYKPKLLKSKNSSFIDSRVQLEYVINDKEIEDNNKDYLLYKYMSDIFLNFSKEDIKKYFELFKINIKNKSVIKSLSDKYLSAVNNEFSVNDIALSDGTKNKFDLNTLIKTKYSNKTVYVDFWASWCGPCIAEMGASRNLRDLYKDKNVVFIYISIDKDVEKWKTASKKQKLSESGNDFIALNYPNSLFYKEIDLKTIPRYLIYNKKGELIHKNAPSPSNKEIEVELSKLELEK
ncbi:TlpA family protein disulfide reductase [Flavobacterium bizetiae]|uniref:TlpA family protein disulfide reductase n=1 Tax=Flavobacterium bizetiae TaxID=2704140 RepID=UPI0037582ACA